METKPAQKQPALKYLHVPHICSPLSSRCVNGLGTAARCSHAIIHVSRIRESQAPPITNTTEAGKPRRDVATVEDRQPAFIDSTSRVIFAQTLSFRGPRARGRSAAIIPLISGGFRDVAGSERDVPPPAHATTNHEHGPRPGLRHGS